MSSYYNPRRTRNLYQPGSEKPFKLSRSKLELFNPANPDLIAVAWVRRKAAILTRLFDQYAAERGIEAEPAEIDALVRGIRKAKEIFD